MTLSDLELVKIQEVLELPKGTPVKIRGRVTHSLKPRKLWKGISQFIVLGDATGSIGCNVSCENIDNGYELDENLVIVGERGEYPEKDRRTGQLTGGVVKNINGYVESSFIDADEDLKEEETDQPSDDTSKTVSVPKYRQEDYWKDKFLLDVERQEVYNANNETIIRECAIKAVTELAGIKFFPEGINFKKRYFEFAEEIVNWIKNDADFKLKTEANLIISGLSPLKKAEIIDWINEARMGTDLEEESQFLIKLDVQILSAQTVKELRETVDKMMKYFTEGE
ncbi:MAG: hypothetical protein E3J83_03250 [Candidatus Atribacteria bacterium]|nr:MAG: hypothetical protein E3J83_03250 [Candidatus Atribacteria bacterium]